MYAIGPQRAHVLNSVQGTDFSDSYFFMRQAFSLGTAAAAFVAAALVPLAIIRRYTPVLLLIAIAASVLLAIGAATGAGFVQCSLGACRWFDLGPFGSMQPAELLKFAVLLFAAAFLGTKARNGTVNQVNETFIPLAALMGVLVVLVIGAQKDMGTGVALLSIIVAMLVVAGVKWRYIGMAGAGLLALFVLLIVTAEHRIRRVLTFLQGDAASLAEGANYHIVHAKIAIGSGGLTGLGIGNSVQATGYLPEAINDSVFAIMGETFGFVGLVVVIFLFGALLMRLLRVASHLADVRLRLIAVGVFGWLGAHVILNIAAMIGVFPLTGLTLPLVSFGGTSMVFIAAALGLVFQLSYHTSFTPQSINGAEKEQSREGIGSRRRVGRSRYTGRSSNR